MTPQGKRMERIGIVGLSWRRGGPELLARYTLTREGREQEVARLAQHIGADELVYLATCNRIEITFALGEGKSVSEVRERVHGFFNDEA
ncbi:MAG: glutamyl-tRNA reductase, partial [Candidatus Paceibacteria bacterium]